MTKRVLLVEDNPDNRDMLSRRLARQGYEVALAVDGEDAVEQARRDPPDIILMDVGLPGMDGRQAFEQIKRLPQTCHTPVIALTAHAMQGDSERFLEAGFDGYHSKPVDFSRLLDQIGKLLQDPRQ